MFLGGDGLINEAQKQKDALDIEKELDKIKEVVIKSINNNNLGNIEKAELQSLLDDSFGSNIAVVTENGENFLIQIKFNDRCYSVTSNGKVEYLGFVED